MYIDKQFKLWKACEKDEMRPAFNYIHFKNGFAYASNARILAKVEFSAIFCGEMDEVEELKHLLDGYAVSAAAWKFLVSLDFLNVKAEGDKKQFFEGMIANNIVRVYTEKSGVLNAPKFESLFTTSEEKKPISKVGISPSLLADLSDALGLSSIRMDFLQADKKIFIHNSGTKMYNCSGIIMPQIITEFLPGFDD